MTLSKNGYLLSRLSFSFCSINKKPPSVGMLPFIISGNSEIGIDVLPIIILGAFSR